jgi:hypothetical protein
VTSRPSWASCPRSASSSTTRRKPGKHIRLLTFQVRYRSLGVFSLTVFFPNKKIKLQVSFPFLWIYYKAFWKPWFQSYLPKLKKSASNHVLYTCRYCNSYFLPILLC